LDPLGKNKKINPEKVRLDKMKKLAKKFLFEKAKA
jgi:hypothetical protein